MLGSGGRTGCPFLGLLWWHHWIWAQDSGLPQLRLQSFLPTYELCDPRQTLTLFKPLIPRQEHFQSLPESIILGKTIYRKASAYRGWSVWGPGQRRPLFLSSAPSAATAADKYMEADCTPWPQGLGPAACLFLVQTHGSESTLQTWEAAGSLPSPTSQDREEKTRTA